MHDSLLLLSPMWVNQLPGHRFPIHRSFSKIPKGEFIRYLQSYADRYSLDQTPNTNVLDVSKEDELFIVSSSQGDFCSRTIVNATGYYGSPYTPDFESNDGSIPIVHSAEYKSPADLEKYFKSDTRKILIVGKRVSAGQLLEELDDAKFSLGMSIRAPIETRTGGIPGVIKENLYYSKEILRFLLNPHIKDDSRALMNGGKTDKIIRSGRLRQHTIIRKIQDCKIEFSDGSHDSYDLIVCATGFKEDFPHLRNLAKTRGPIVEQLEMGEHRTNPGLFFLGVDNLISLRSRYVRGVASDSKIVAERVCNYIERHRK